MQAEELAECRMQRTIAVCASQPVQQQQAETDSKGTDCLLGRSPCAIFVESCQQTLSISAGPDGTVRM